ncbi:MAG: protein-methionine-sulfoxide reductase catalytic subunit MsrP [Anaerolineaceae bacterium]|nr:protein-methionine-sulfoxide reductase catalytic subunit MsrP [Anaerolineaceae bacterium]
MKNPFSKSVPVKSSEITPESAYFSRRDFMKAAGVAGATAALLAACGTAPQGSLASSTPGEATTVLPDVPTDYEAITHYNNFYEFSTDKEAVARLAEKFQPSPWQVEVYGLVEKPQTFSIEDVLAKFPREERVYRLRCVEGWSMVIPWTGFPLGKLLKEVAPTGDAKYVRFETVYRPDEMPGQNSMFYPWPYQEGLRMDEAMHDLTLLATGMYGKEIPNQDGAPLRLVVPWKYGFKSIKSIVKIELVDYQPATLWNTIAPDEYGFYSNVNPQRPHPRWSQESERRIGDTTFSRRPTLMFNGYADEVAQLYTGIDLIQNY